MVQCSGHVIPPAITVDPTHQLAHDLALELDAQCFTVLTSQRLRDQPRRPSARRSTPISGPTVPSRERISNRGWPALVGFARRRDVDPRSPTAHPSVWWWQSLLGQGVRHESFEWVYYSPTQQYGLNGSVPETHLYAGYPICMSGANGPDGNGVPASRSGLRDPAGTSGIALPHAAATTLA